MTLLQTPTSTAETIVGIMSETIENPGVFGLAVSVIGIVAVFWLLEFLTGRLIPYPIVKEQSYPQDIDDDLE